MPEIPNPATLPRPSAEVLKVMYSEPHRLTSDEQAIVALENVKCQRSYLYFRNYCKLDVPSTMDNMGGATPFAFWPHLCVLAENLQFQKLIDLMKSRQIGASWEFGGYSDWRCTFFPSTVGILMSMGEEESALLLDKAKFIDRNLPWTLRKSYDKKGKENDGPRNYYEFPQMGSNLTALPATESAGVSRTASFIIADEWEQHPYAEQNYAKAKPAIADGGAQFIGCFTIDPWKSDSLARTTWLDGKDGKNGFRSLFFGYKSRPGRDEAWYDHEMKTIPDKELKGLTREAYMRANYPETWQQALSPVQSISAFDLPTLDHMAEDLRNPLPIPDGLLVDKNIFHIYKPHSIGNFYSMGSDVSHGVGQDYSVTVVLNVKTGEVVADIVSNVISDTDFAALSVALWNYYGRPKWWIENNDWGRSVINKALELGCSNLGYEDDQKKNKLGYHTGPGPSRDAIWHNLIPAINNRQVVIYSDYGLKQMYQIIRNSEKNGRIEAKNGANDDYAMALGIAWLKRTEVHAMVDPHAFDPIATLHFREPAKETVGAGAFAPMNTLRFRG